MSTNTSPRREQVRVGLAVIGGLVFALGLLTLVAPSAAAASLGALVVLLGNDYLVVAILGVLALVLLVGILVATGRAGFDQGRPPAPEGVYPVPRFGEEIDAFIAGGGFAGSSGDDRHDEIRAELREVAITTVMRDGNLTRSEALDRIEAGTWTDDDVAATYLAEGKTPSLGSRLRATFGGESPAEQAVRVTAAEIGRLDAEAVR